MKGKNEILQTIYWTSSPVYIEEEWYVISPQLMRMMALEESWEWPITDKWTINLN